MRRLLTSTLLVMTCLVMTCFALPAYAQCTGDDDHRSEKRGGIVVTDFNITGTTTLSSTDLMRISRDFIGSCYNDDSEEIQERVRAEFQDRGYFAVEVRNLSVKASDPLGNPKPVSVEAEVTEGLKYKLGQITFLENHAFSTERLRDQFPLKTGDVFERGKVVSGLMGLGKFYSSNGYLDFSSIPDTEPASSGLMTLKVTVDEGRQYHMGKLEILAPKEIEARLRAAWKMAEGSPYDSTYIAKFVDENRSLLPEGFTPAEVHQVSNCPKAIVDLSLPIDPHEGKSELPAKSTPCETEHVKSK